MVFDEHTGGAALFTFSVYLLQYLSVHFLCASEVSFTMQSVIFFESCTDNVVVTDGRLDTWLDNSHACICINCPSSKLELQQLVLRPTTATCIMPSSHCRRRRDAGLAKSGGVNWIRDASRLLPTKSGNCLFRTSEDGSVSVSQSC